jgi:hypothetical protein
MTVGNIRGTPGYYPLNDELRDGSSRWDIWAIGAIILESNMERDEYLETLTD